MDISLTSAGAYPWESIGEMAPPETSEVTLFTMIL